LAVELQCHPAKPSSAIRSVSALIYASAQGLRIRYSVAGDVSALRLPQPQKPYRTDGLWDKSCFELFIGREGTGYHEYNFSPSGQWAAYAFDSYRTGMKALAMDGYPPHIMELENSPHFLEISCLVDVTDLHDCQIGISVVLEETDGTKSYWALRHPPGKPDFHHRDCFALKLAPPDVP
jgi:hypothetical protein